MNIRAFNHLGIMEIDSCTSALIPSETGDILVVYKGVPMWVPGEEYKAQMEAAISKALKEAQDLFFADLFKRNEKYAANT